MSYHYLPKNYITMHLHIVQSQNVVCMRGPNHVAKIFRGHGLWGLCGPSFSWPINALSTSLSLSLSQHHDFKLFDYKPSNYSTSKGHVYK
jgi:hypothetical protein